jgi:hypothetical protein
MKRPAYITKHPTAATGIPVAYYAAIIMTLAVAGWLLIWRGGDSASDSDYSDKWWASGSTVVSLIDSGKTLRVFGRGNMGNYYDAICDSWWDWYDHIPWVSVSSGVTGVVIESGVTRVKDMTFSACTNLQSINVSKDNPKYSSADGVLFNKTGKTLLLYPRGKQGAYTVPDGVVKIEKGAFSHCPGLTSITVAAGNARYSSEDGVLFNKNKTLLIQHPAGKQGASYTIPNGVAKIGDIAFENRTGLTSVTIPNSVTSIGDSAFKGCDGLTSVTIPNGVASIGEEAFSSCSSLTSATIPNSVTSIGERAFWRCLSLTSITLPNNLTKIEEGTFMYCTGLTSVAIPDGVKSIGRAAFSYCDGLTSVTIPNSVTSLGTRLFEGIEVFKGCINLTSVTIGNSVKSIGVNTFAFTGLTSVTIPDRVTHIWSRAFLGCRNLTSVTIGKSVEYIADFAFLNCVNLTSVTVLNPTPPEQQRSISFENIYSNATIYAFDSIDSNVTLYVPKGSIEAYRNAEGWKKFKSIKAIDLQLWRPPDL